jgi:predicted transcriptional regulator
MAPLPDHRPRQLSLGPLETEILAWLWQLETATGKEIHDRILADPNRELAYASVMTVLHRLQQKGWVCCEKRDRALHWWPLVTQNQARALQAHDQLQQFLKVGNPDVVAAFADSLDSASLEKLDAIARRLRALRQAREDS